ncbi:NeuD/PglB/VioB family sugar acetyltransferase [Qaidamihabitans albus]|uniref:NeuD/PglB/VioB family sugar acetyltransferase n=1 Tax=Qaidamihabitans albus TaxID=2795733 RepID=UPI0018F1D07A|nr:NeuD/PglB/VioB family sugar acetyltransferase [Qaidamihabitans albus]
MKEITRLVVFGHGGFAKRMPAVVADLNGAGASIELTGFLVEGDDATQRGEHRILGCDEQFVRFDAHYVIAIANSAVRNRLDDFAVQLGGHAATIVHPRACVEPSEPLGQGTIVLAGAAVNANSVIGRQVHINNNVVIGHDAHIEEYATLNPLCMIGGAAHIGKRALIGAGSVVLPGVRIGNDAVVGAGAVVVRDVPVKCRVAGSPARELTQRT